MVTDYEIYQEIDEFDEDLDTDDLVGPEDLPPVSVVDYDYPEGDIQYVDMVSDKILDPADLAGRRYCTFIDKWAGFIQLEQQIMEWVDSCPWLAFDIETYKKTHEPFKRNEPPGWRTDLMGAFSISDGETTYVFKLDPMVRPDYTNEENLKPLFLKILDKPLVGHNLKFDLRFMMRYYDKYPPLCFDTFLAAKVIHCARGVKYDLKSVVERYLKIQLSKEQQRSAWGSLMFLTPQISYSGRDTFYVAKLVAPMVAAMDKDPESWSKNKTSDFTKVWGLKNKVAHLEFYLLPRLMLMEHHGVFMNIDEVEHQFNRLKNIEGGLKQKWFNELADLKERPINPNSSKKVFQFLTGFKMGGQGFIRPDGDPMTLRKISSIDQDEIKEFVGHGIPCIDALVDYKSTTGNIKRIEEFHKLTDPKTTRLYTSFKQWGAVSGRTSCPKPNLQNIKNAEKNGINLRSLFMAPPGRKLVVVDYSQIQLVIVAEISQDQTMRDIINSGGDLHTATAIAVSGHSNITKDERKQAKSVNFGYVFGMGPAKFQEFARMGYKLYFDLDTCSLMRDRYFSLYPGVGRWHKKVGFGKRNGFYPIQTLYGRKITADGFTKATNFPVQGTEKDIVALAISFITDRLIQTQLDGFLVNCIHDELVAEVSEHDAEYVREIMSEEMIRAAHMILKTVKVRADGHIVDMWSAAK